MAGLHAGGGGSSQESHELSFEEQKVSLILLQIHASTSTSGIFRSVAHICIFSFETRQFAVAAAQLLLQSNVSASEAQLCASGAPVVQ